MKKPNAGFSVIDLLVAAGITILLLSVVVANFRQGSQNQDIGRAVDQLTSRLRLVQVNSLSGSRVGICYVSNPSAPTGQEPVGLCDSSQGCLAGACRQDVPVGGYGVSFVDCVDVATCRMSVFADINEDLLMNTAPGSNELISTDSIGPHQFISGLFFDGVGTDPNCWHPVLGAIAVFQPPTVVFRVGAGTPAAPTDIRSIIIELTDEQNAQQRFIAINRYSGVIQEVPAGNTCPI